MDETKKILDFDPIEAIETLAGKHYKDFSIENELAAFKLSMVSGRYKRDYLKSIGDTYYGISWKDFIEIVKAYGFKCGYQKFIATEDVKEEEFIFFNQEKGLILYAESVNENYVGIATVYGEVKIDKKLTQSQREALEGCSHDGIGNRTMHFDVDVREGLNFHLNAISEAFEFCNPWSELPFLWFLNTSDIQKEDYNREEINQKKINACNPAVKKIIFG